MMKEIVTEHPLRTIILRFDLKKTQLKTEKRGLDAHYHMHDLTWTMQQQLHAHYQTLEEIEIQVNELKYYLLPIEQDLDMLEVFLGIKDPSVLPFDEKDDNTEIDIDLDAFYKDVSYHNQRIQDLHDEVSKEYNWYKQHFDMMYEKESWIDDSLWDDVHQIYLIYTEVQVDIVTLDRDQEEFREILSEVFDYQEIYREYAETLFQTYNELQKRSEENYRRTEIVNQALHKMQS
ncbi:hypothetical protein H8B06_07760 [Sphingobacterium sp. DN00404]|uniref:Uncharacterized protein n=1 Tax=Sphingobacterium micropteri TaxID=2763501 RepID=A0ABR7YN06_9SPHI|nr:hypothetical protein [Sphingobacterium micropteri]MBD1432714.1 hypothetical protein [Sphingobacterium micropteri]